MTTFHVLLCFNATAFILSGLWMFAECQKYESEIEEKTLTFEKVSEIREKQKRLRKKGSFILLTAFISLLIVLF
ncbi:MAG: hypothetical protein QM715_15360 [Nibricoccus sp.]